MSFAKPGGVVCCDGISRRDLLHIGGLGAAGLMLPDLLWAQGLSKGVQAASGPKFGTAKRVILLFMSGGPPPQDTFDLKPDAPNAEARGGIKPIQTHLS